MRVFIDLAWYFRQQWKRYIGSILVLLLVSLFELMPPYLIGYTVDGVVDGGIETKTLAMIVLGSIGLWTMVYFLRIRWRIWLFGAAAQLGKVLRDRLYRCFSSHSPRFFERYKTGDLMARGTNDVRAVEMTAGEGVLTGADSLINGILVLIVMTAALDWRLTLLALLPMPIMGFLTNRLGKRLHTAFRQSQSAFSDLSDYTQSSLNGVRMTRAFGLENRQINGFNEAADITRRKNMEVEKVDSLFDPVIQITIGLSFFLSVSGGGYLVATDQMTIGELTAFTLYQGLMIWPMLALAWLFNIIERGSAAWARLKEVFDEEPEIKGGDKTPGNHQVINIELPEFTWRGHSEPTLKNISLQLAPGKMLGIAGPVGSGKSTLLNLLLRLEDAEKGGVSYGGVDIREFTLGSWRGKFAVVTQAPFLFSRTIEENIALGRPDASFEEIRHAAKQACIDEDILQLPDGYKTEVGEKGITLSGGQKQRIAIARALLLDAEILILDDSLSAVDGRTEHTILENLRKRQAHQAMIVVAHRLSALESADQIIVLQKGHIDEKGSHNALVEQKSWYAQMHRYQKMEQVLEGK
ncbi:multidrug ABC transporter permease/ATP-binding protein [Veronia nyctiphanis]|uniref:Multidrug resistance-like ATP-binding protein MdlA n=1 Tax=Veronia nyctiphanis TaxID=1278244 RepID=A0A4Q0YT80_9GAMM|nr:ABC transporter transmembrane domain-containing protein [Veronia nyctiphanis]RXJ73913.1 multidrug ABC transporter permease/ATP-binding protein [Veronia nyctiphanis]